MDMDKAKMFDAALDRLIGDMDDMEGDAAMSHSLEACEDPLGCKMHDSELGDNLAPEKSLEMDHKPGLPSLDGGKDKPAEEGLSQAEVEELRKLLK